LGEEFKKMKTIAPEEKKAFGQQLSEIKSKLNLAYDEKSTALTVIEINKKLEKDLVDISLESPSFVRGHYGLLARVRKNVEDICKNM
jgi:phenylalanyl-tRNA synthetase alpha chain